MHQLLERIKFLVRRPKISIDFQAMKILPPRELTKLGGGGDQVRENAPRPTGGAFSSPSALPSLSLSIVHECGKRLGWIPVASFTQYYDQLIRACEEAFYMGACCLEAQSEELGQLRQQLSRLKMSDQHL